MADLKIEQKGVGIHTVVTIHHPSGCAATVSGSARGYQRTTSWTASLTMPVPPDLNRKPPAVQWWGGVPDSMKEPASFVLCPIIDNMPNREQATAAAIEALNTWDFAAKLHETIEAQWDRLYAFRRAQYFDSLKNGESEARVVLIRQLRTDPAVAAVFPEPPERE